MPDIHVIGNFGRRIVATGTYKVKVPGKVGIMVG